LADLCAGKVSTGSSIQAQGTGEVMAFPTIVFRINNRKEDLMLLGENIFVFQHHTLSVSRILWSEDSNHLASFGDDGMYIWHAQTGRIITFLQELRAEIYGLQWQKERLTIALGLFDHIRTYDVVDLKPQLRWQVGEMENECLSLAWSPDGNYLAAGDSQGMIRIWDGKTGKQVKHMVLEDEEAVECLDWSPNGESLAAGSVGGLIQVYKDIIGESIFKTRHTTKSEESDIHAVVWSPNGKLLASASSDQTVHIWEPTHSSPLSVYSGHQGTDWGNIRAIAWSPDNTKLVSGDDSSRIDVWDALTSQYLFTCRDQSTGAPQDVILSVAWSPNGAFIASSSSSSTVSVWQAS
jgi:WD40 repeat protein